MVKLLIIADDFTGALDTSIQFAKRGAVTEVHTDKDVDYRALSPEVNVIVIDSETRHVTADEAYKVVSEIVERALKAKIPFIYKKTDSVLRGNVGAELAALCDGVRGIVHFVPAYPKMGRTTNNGIQYVNGVPIAKSVFGEDPFEPVLTSNIPEIIKAGTKTRVNLVLRGNVLREPVHDGIYVYDAETDKDLLDIADKLSAEDQIGVSAGCAGFADALASVLHMEGKQDVQPDFPDNLFVVCGSVNPVTVRQLDVAEAEGVPRISLDSTMRLDKKWVGTLDAERTIRSWISIMREEGSFILDVNNKKLKNDIKDRINPEDRSIISGNLGKIVKSLLDDDLDAMLLLTGGDTLLGAMDAMHINALRPVTELMPGVVAFIFNYGGRNIYCTSKSGGFGNEKLILDLCNILNKDKEIGVEKMIEA